MRLIRTNRRPEASNVQMHWSVIFTGAFITLGCGLFFLLLGNAIGLNAANILSRNVTGGLRVGSWIYMLVTLVFSYFIGGFLATRSERVDTPSSGMLHGFTCWGLATAILLIQGGIASFVLRVIFAGLANDATNWLVVCILGAGAFCSAVGGAIGKFSRHELVSTREGRIEEGGPGERRIA